MKKNIWFLLAAVISLHGAAFAIESDEKAESSEVASSQERNQENQGAETSVE